MSVYYNPIIKENTPFPYRFKTEQEFITEFGKLWYDRIHYGWNQKGMKSLLGITYPFNITKDEDRLPQIIADGDVWCISLDMIIKNDAKPNYEPRKINRLLESNKNYNFYIYSDNRKDSIRLEEMLHTLGWIWKNDSKYLIKNNESISAVTIGEFQEKNKFFNGWRGDYCQSVLYFRNLKRYNYPEDSIYIRTELGEKPDYSPKKMNRLLEYPQFQLNINDLLLEKSSLSALGVPKEVMQPIQKDFAIPPNAQWNRIRLKKDAEKILREGEKELLLQIETDSIKVFVSYMTTSGDKYFVDTYILEDKGWVGEYKKIPREEITLTQLLYQINSKSLLYQLTSPFSLIRQSKRKLIEKEKKFEQFTTKFKEDFLSNFDTILKRIVGSKYNDVKQEIKDKARQMEIENQMMLSGLDDPLEGPNSLTILDEFIMQFEDAYSEFFGERLDIQELSKYFTREKIMTSFMYFIYTGKLLER